MKAEEALEKIKGILEEAGESKDETGGIGSVWHAIFNFPTELPCYYMVVYTGGRLVNLVNLGSGNLVRLASVKVNNIDMISKGEIKNMIPLLGDGALLSSSLMEATRALPEWRRGKNV